MKKEAQIILLPTDKASNIFLKDNNQLEHNDNPPIHGIKNLGWKYQFYYVLSDEEIKEGDWYLNDILNTIHQRRTGQRWNYCPNYKKIIATNDGSLVNIRKNTDYLVTDFPQLSQQGLELLCKLYNEKKELKVMVEYDEINGNNVNHLVEEYNPLILKVDSQNCITISEVEEDVEKLAKETTKKYINGREKQTAYLEFILGYKAAKQSKEGRMYSREEMYLLSAYVTNQIAAHYGDSDWNMKTTPKMLVDKWTKENLK